MPVFETGAFNHSATCPAASQGIDPGDLLQPGSITRIGFNTKRTRVTSTRYSMGSSSVTFEIVVVDGSRLGVRYGLSTFEISSRILWPLSTSQRLPYVGMTIFCWPIANRLTANSVPWRQVLASEFVGARARKDNPVFSR
jgi:hypothetical protein